MRFPYLKILSLLALLPFAAAAQDITGLWKGTLYNDTTRETLRFEIGISQEKGKMTGFSHTFIQHDDRLYFAIKKIKVKNKDGKVIVQDGEIIANNSPLTPPKGVYKTAVLTLVIKDSIMELSGNFITNPTREYHPLTGRVFLERKNDYYQSDLLTRLAALKLADAKNFEPLARMQSEAPAAAIALQPAAAPAAETEPAAPALAPVKEAASKTDPQAVRTAPAAAIAGNKSIATENYPVNMGGNDAGLTKLNGAVAPAGSSKATVMPAAISPGKTVAVTVNKPMVTFEPAAAVNERRLETVETVYFSSDSLQLTLYDNGEVDGDTVSVLLNGRLIMPKQGLSTRAIRKTIFLPKGTDSVQLVMYAENLGSIPPNTGLLVVHDGDAVHEIRFSADMNKNSAVVLRRRKE